MGIYSKPMKMTHLLGFLFNLSTAECLTHARQARLGDQKHQKKNVMPQTGLRRSLCTVQEVFPSAALALLQAAPDVVNKLSLSTSAAKETFHTVHGEIVHPMYQTVVSVLSSSRVLSFH